MEGHRHTLGGHVRALRALALRSFQHGYQPALATTDAQAPVGVELATLIFGPLISYRARMAFRALHIIQTFSYSLALRCLLSRIQTFFHVH